LAHVTWPRAQPLGQSISLKFSLETRLESESFWFQPKWPKTYLTYHIIHKKSETQNQEFFFIADLLSPSRVWTTLYRNWLRSHAVAKTHENCLIFGSFQSTIYSYVGSKRVNNSY